MKDLGDRACCICGESTYNIKFLFCKSCYDEWYKPHGTEPWLKYLMAQEQSRSRRYKQYKNDLSLEGLDI